MLTIKRPREEKNSNPEKKQQIPLPIPPSIVRQPAFIRPSGRENDSRLPISRRQNREHQVL